MCSQEAHGLFAYIFLFTKKTCEQSFSMEKVFMLRRNISEYR